MTQSTPPRRSPLGVLRQFHRPVEPNAPTLLIFPHAGSGASTYRALSELFSTRFTVRIAQYPGRQDRGGEPAAESLGDLAAEAYAEYASIPPTGPITVFGHSMGSIVGFEFVRLAERGGQRVDQLVVSAATAPSNVAELPPHPADDDALLTHLQALNGTGGAVMGSDAVMRMALPALKADYRAFDAYTCSPGARIAAPVRVLGGADDPVIRPHQLHGWTTHSDTVTVSTFSGGHFYLYDHGPGIADILTHPVAASTS